MKSFKERFSDIEIIDFHTHPFSSYGTCISAYYDTYPKTEADILPEMKSYGISKICGSCIHMRGQDGFSDVMERIISENKEIYELSKKTDGFIVPGIHIHPNYIEESIQEIEKYARVGVRLIGELVPYLHEWQRYDAPSLAPILRAAAKHNMIVSFHEMESESADEMVRQNPDIMFVAAHPGEKNGVLAHVERMKKYDNVCLDISGTGIFRYNALKYIVGKVGSERVLFGTDYPICNPGVYIGGVLSEPLSDSETENIFSLNAKRLLGIY